MSWSGSPALLPLAAAGPSPAPSTAPPQAPVLRLPTSAQDVSTSTKEAAGWLDANWASWVEGAVRIVIIVVLALLLRAVVRKLIAQFIHRMTREPEADVETVSRLGGLLVNTERRQQRSAAIGSVLKSVSSFTILGTAALMVLSALGMDLAPLLASAGVAGVAIGFGARNLVTDFLSGVFMIMEDQYGVGDEIDTGVATGTVLEVGLRVTKLRGASGEIWYIRNGEVKRIANMSQGWSTATVDVQVGYRERLDRVEELILQTAQEFAKEAPWDELLWNPVEVLGVESVAADTVVLRVQARTMPGKAALVTRGLRQWLKQAFDDAGIKLKEEPGTASALAVPPTVADALPPSALADPASARSLATRPIPLPTPEEQQAFGKLP
ncbi:mechanosensitive ion channel family protein [Kitasatospora sp. NBC_01287]|uniref:mechanosensitive ion channel family protein n=1 Tax=Kitasatospora sp. NBC_01287 TaxID=2903573 RepID=UPI00224F343C|nr:mechanosensitive ion channel family protein [Kitasatospora sp. NBC_01287]MCX4746316.1 mechanosensitive ion channel family protein [Kitasatospora sp. NBC_01287]